ncbi:MAG: secretin N-terminal domain-containing protein [Fimbriimonadaceae bacterium]
MKQRMQLISTLAMALAIVSPGTALAEAGAPQFNTGASAAQERKPAWEEFKLPNKTVRLNFRNANVDLVLDLFMKVSGVTIVKDPNLKEPMSLSSAKAVPIKEAFEILNAALSVRNYELVKQGNLLLIKKKEERQSGFGSMSPEQLQQMMGGGSGGPTTLEVYRIKYASATEVARIINEVFQQQEQAANPFAQFFGGGGGGRTQRGGGRGGNTGFSFGGQSFGGGSQQPSVRASSDDFSNSVIVNAPQSKQRDVEDLIQKVDQLTDAPLQTKIYKLEYAAATDLVTSIQTILTANAPQGRGNTGQSNQGGFGAFIRRATGPGVGEANVTADSRSNSLIVSATSENHKIIEQLMPELDKEVEVQNTTFVIPLQNARADSVATLLTSAFGTSNRNNGRNTGATNTGRNTGAGNTNNRNRNGGGGNGGGGGAALNGGRGIEDVPARFSPNAKGENELVMEFEDQNDELYTQVRTGQGGFFGGFGQQNQQGSGSGNVARGADGRLVNVRDLSGQVNIIPDPNTNSLIIVTAPENMELIRQILGQLDKIPEQVMIETLIVEATLDKSLKLGVEWNYNQNPAFGNQGTSGNVGTNFGQQTASPALQGLRYTLTGGNFSAFINALASDDKFQVLSTPRIFTSNNVEAEINISQSVPYILSTREDANGNLTFNYAFQDVGIVLNVIPRITANGTVTLDVTQTANDLQGFTDFNAPIVNQRQAFTTVSVADGSTVVLGGMMRNTVTSKVRKLPILGDIPLLGELFKTRDKQDVKTELLVFLTPRIVRGPEESDRLRSDEVGRLSEPSQKAMQQALPPKGKGDSGIKTGPKKVIGQ